jgi:putative RNA 2'-phosphotransferase
MLAYMLGRRPDEFGLVPDVDGFVKTKELLKALHEEEGWGYVNESHLREVHLTVADPPVELEADRIRAHRRDPFIAQSPPEERPPKLLFAAVRRRAYPHVHANGIDPSSHPQVVLTRQREHAERLGRRIDPDPVILTVNVRTAEDQGATFARFGEHLFLAGRIPAGCFSGPPLPAEPSEEIRKSRRPDNRAARSATPGSFSMDAEKAVAPHVPESLKRRIGSGGKIDSKRLKRGTWIREKPPWKKN